MPWAALNTIVPVCPPVPSSGKCSASTANPAALPEPGTWALPLNCEPTAPAAPKMATKATSQSPMALIR